jgi:hypothetical protein
MAKNKTLNKRNPPPPTVSCVPSGDGGPHCLHPNKRRKNKKQRQPVPPADWVVKPICVFIFKNI